MQSLTTNQKKILIDDLKSAVDLKKRDLAFLGMLYRKIQKSFEIGNLPHQLYPRFYELLNFARIYPESDISPKIIKLILYIVTERYNATEAAFLCNYISLDINSITKTKASLIPLTEEETDAALELLFKDTPPYDDLPRLIELASRRISNWQVEKLLPQRYFSDLKKLIVYLKEHAGDTEEYRYEIAARSLQYLELEDDVIPDHHGAIGLIDDMYVLHTAVTEIFPDLKFLDEVLEETKIQIPFLDQVFFEKNDNIGSFVTDYDRTYTLPCVNYIQDIDAKLSHINFSENPTEHAVHCAIIASLLSVSLSPSFQNNNEVTEEIDIASSLVLNEIYRFDKGREKYKYIGEETVMGQEMLVFESISDSTAIIRKSKDYVNKLNKPTTAGRFKETDAEMRQLNFLETLFDKERVSYDLLDVPKQIILVSNRVKYRAVLDGLTINGHKWIESIPIAEIKQSGIDMLTPNCENQKPALLLAPNMTTLINYDLDYPLSKDTVIIIDGSTELDSINLVLDFIEQDIPMMVFVGTHAYLRDLQIFYDNSYSVLRIKNDIKNYLNGFTKFDSYGDWKISLLDKKKSNYTCQNIKSNAASEVTESLGNLRTLRISNSEKIGRSADELIESIIIYTYEILKLGSEFANSDYYDQEIDIILSRLRNWKQEIERNHLLDDEQKKVLAKHIDVLSENVDIVVSDRISAILNYIESGIKFDGIITEKLGISSLQNFRFSDLIDQIDNSNLLCAHWPNQRKMLKEIRKGFGTNQIHFILFSHEEAGLKGFEKKYEITEISGEPYYKLNQIHLSNDESSENRNNEETPSFDISGIRELVNKKLESEINSNIQKLAEINLLFYLDDDKLLMSTNRSTFTVASPNNDESNISEKYADQIRVGDRILFFENSERSVIREYADRYFLKNNERHIAQMWQIDLKKYYDSLDIDLQTLQKNLSDIGVSRTTQTINAWLYDTNIIAPRSKEVIKSIYMLIGVDIDDKTLDVLLSAIRKIRSSHVKAGELISNEIRSSIAEGKNHEFSIYEVSGIDLISQKAPYSMISKPILIN